MNIYVYVYVSISVCLAHEGVILWHMLIERPDCVPGILLGMGGIELCRRGNMSKGLEVRRSWMNRSVLWGACCWYFGRGTASWCGASPSAALGPFLAPRPLNKYPQWFQGVRVTKPPPSQSFPDAGGGEAPPSGWQPRWRSQILDWSRRAQDSEGGVCTRTT